MLSRQVNSICQFKAQEWNFIKSFNDVYDGEFKDSFNKCLYYINAKTAPSVKDLEALSNVLAQMLPMLVESIPAS